jgi:hypothetical protein
MANYKHSALQLSVTNLLSAAVRQAVRINSDRAGFYDLF